MSVGAVLVAASLSWSQGIDSARALNDIPGFDFSALSSTAKEELVSVLTDEFDYCGRALTLLASLKKGDACAHTKRLVRFAAALAADGAAASEIIVQLAKYNQGFLRARTTFKFDERQCLGPKEAKVTLVEFSDFECPHCAAARPILENFVQKRSQVRLCMLPFPLQQHVNAIYAGQAALFARDGGKFWEVHDALFENQLSLSEDFIRQLLIKQGFNLKNFDKALADKKYVSELEAAKEAGKKAGVEATPSLFLNGRKYSLSLAAPSLAMAVEDELEWISSHNAWPAN